MSNEAAVYAAFKVYADALNAYDDQGVRDAFVWPLARMTADGVEIVSNPPALPSEMRAKSGWVKSIFEEVDVVAATDTKAHLILRRFQRLRADGSLIEAGSTFYAYRKIDQGWKIFAISGIIL